MKNFVMCAGAAIVLAAATLSAQTAVPGHARNMDQNGNGFPDVGVAINGHYESIYAYDALGGWYWDLGDGRLQGTVSDPAQLDQATLTTCDYVVNYRGTFEDTPFQDTGWIMNQINCTGAEHGTYHYLFVHESDPRYTGNPEWAIWGTWEYHVLVESGTGNLVKKLPRH